MNEQPSKSSRANHSPNTSKIASRRPAGVGAGLGPGLQPRARPALLAAFEEREDELVLRREVAVERHLRRTRLGDDPVDPHRLGSVPAEEFVGGLEDPLTATGGCHSPSTIALARMTSLPDPSLDASSAFVQGAGLVIDDFGGDEVTGHIDAGPGAPHAVGHGPRRRLRGGGRDRVQHRRLDRGQPRRPVRGRALQHTRTSCARTATAGSTSEPCRSTRGGPASSGTATSRARTASSSRRARAAAERAAALAICTFPAAGRVVCADAAPP